MATIASVELVFAWPLEQPGLVAFPMETVISPLIRPSSQVDTTLQV